MTDNPLVIPQSFPPQCTTALLSVPLADLAYALRLRMNQTLQPTDERTFNRWLTTSLEGALPGRTAPEPVVPLTVVAVTKAMP